MAETEDRDMEDAEEIEIELGDKQNCPNCGAEVDGDETVCQNCGAILYNDGDMDGFEEDGDMADF